MDLLALREEELGEVGAVLAGDSGDEGLLRVRHAVFPRKGSDPALRSTGGEVPVEGPAEALGERGLRLPAEALEGAGGVKPAAGLAVGLGGVLDDLPRKSGERVDDLGEVLHHTVA